MSRRYRVRQNPAISAFSAIGSLVFLFAGCAMMNQGGASAPTSFQFVWVIACLAGFCISIYNAASDEGIATDIIQEDFSDGSNTGAGTPLETETPDTASLLRELEKLRIENLITDAEYEQKRNAVLSRFD